MPIVSPTNDVFFCRELPLFEWWEKIPEGKEGVNIILKYATYSLVVDEKTREEGGHCNLVVIWWEKSPEGKKGQI